MNDSLREKEKRAIEVLRSFEPQDEPYYLCYSGGKDSDVIRILAQLAGVKHDIVHNLTTVDAPETVQYIKSIPNIIIDKARWQDGTHKTMWNLIPYKKLPPTMLARYCCQDLKEQGGKGRLKITGVRKAESRKRAENGGLVKVIGKEKTMAKLAEELGVTAENTSQGGLILNMDNDDNRRLVEQCYRTTSTMANPIIDWTDDDVWDFLNYYNCKSNPLYHECEYGRIGCVGCPFAQVKRRKKELELYPKIRDNYIRAFAKMLERYKESGITSQKTWHNGVDVLKWWVKDDAEQLRFYEEDYLKNIPDELYENII